MADLKQYKLFISHSWTYSNAYARLTEFFDEHPNFSWRNYSVPKNDPIHNASTQKELYEAIKQQIAPVNCVLILAGVYSSYSKWIDKEIDIAKNYNKPIIAIQPWGAERTSQKVKDNANKIVNWNSSSIVDSIRKYSI